MLNRFLITLMSKLMINAWFLHYLKSLNIAVNGFIVQ